MSLRQPLQSATTSPTATGTMNISSVVKVAPFSLKDVCAVFKWWSCEFLYKWSCLCCFWRCTSCRSPVNQAVNLPVWGRLCVVFAVGVVAVSAGHYSHMRVCLCGFSMQSDQVTVDGQTHSVNNIPRILACAYCPVLLTCEPDNPVGHTLLSAVCQSGSSVYSKQTTVAAAGNIKRITSCTPEEFFLGKMYVTFKQNSWGYLSTWEVEYAIWLVFKRLNSYKPQLLSDWQHKGTSPCSHCQKFWVILWFSPLPASCSGTRKE